MKKAVLFILELAGLIGAILGFIGLVSSAGEIQYRREPPIGFIVGDDDFAAMVHREEERSLLELLLKADMDYMMGNDGAAIQDLTQVIQSHPGFAKGYYFRGIFYLSKGGIQAGISDLRSVLEISRDTELRRQAEREILLAQIAQVLTPIVYLGLVGYVAFFIANRVGVKIAEWQQPVKVSIFAACALWVCSLIFLLFH